MYSKTRTKLGIIYESCKLSGRLIASLAKVEQSLSVWHIAEYVYRPTTAVRYHRARAEAVGVEIVKFRLLIISKYIGEFLISIHQELIYLSFSYVFISTIRVFVSGKIRYDIIFKIFTHINRILRLNSF